MMLFPPSYSRDQWTPAEEAEHEAQQLAEECGLDLDDEGFEPDVHEGRIDYYGSL